MIRLDRRGLLAGIGASFLAGAARGGEGAVYVGARLDTDGAASVAAFDLDGRELFATALPGRGHDMAVHPSGDEFVVLARRPGRFAAVLASAGGAVRQMILARPDRHFFGHGTYAPDGRLFYTTENALEDEAGRIGVHDVAAGYRRIGEFTSGGVGPHDIARFRRGGRVVLAVANGGIRTHPDTGRDMLNVETMRANLAFIDAATGDRLNAVRAQGGRIIAGGTTSLRLLESAATEDKVIRPFEGDTSIFITPGYRFKAIDGLMTNFHLPKSTLFMLVSALMGLETMQAAYAHAIGAGYRLYSYGDSSLLLPLPNPHK